MLQTGKLHFGYIYGFGMLGCIAVYLIINLMSGTYARAVGRTTNNAFVISNITQYFGGYSVYMYVYG